MKAIVTYELYCAGRQHKHARLVKHIQKVKDDVENCVCEYRCEICASGSANLFRVYKEWYTFARLEGKRSEDYYTNHITGTKMIRYTRVWER